MLDASFLTKFDWDTETLLKEVLELDLKLFERGFSFEDPIRFQVLGNVLESLAEKAPTCKKIVLYTGPLLWEKKLPFSPSLESRYQEWIADTYADPENSSERRAVFQVNVLMDYLHRLASFAPEQIQFSVRFTDTACLEQPLLAHLFSKQRFTHFTLEEFTLDGDVGFVLPQDGRVDQATYHHIATLLTKHQGAIRIVPEMMIPELWTCLKTLYVEKEKMTRYGIRGLSGFAAAEGEVVYLGDL